MIMKAGGVIGLATVIQTGKAMGMERTGWITTRGMKEFWAGIAGG